MSGQINRLFSVKHGTIITARQVLSYSEEILFKLRRDLRDKKRGALLCAECYQPLVLAGSINQVLHFKHYPGSDDCPMKSTCQLTSEEILAIKFNGQKESQEHKFYKNFIAGKLRSDTAFTDVHVEKTFREESVTGVAKKWRRPDVSAVQSPDGLRVAVELQVSTTYIDVIIEREEFYRKNNAAIIWIFLEFDNSRFTEKDIFYSSNLNAFVLDAEAEAKSRAEDKLYLKCVFKEYFLHEEGYEVSLHDTLTEKLVAITDLHWNQKLGKILYHDAEASRRSLEEQRKVRQKQLDSKKEQEHRRLSGNSPFRAQYQRNNEGKPLEESVGAAYGAIVKRGAANKLKCPQCQTTSNFRNRGPFIYCNQCDIEIKY